jgi:superfamily II DNA/RNA helicase
VRFAELGLPVALVEALARRGFEAAFEVQAFTIPDALAGRDVAARAPTGSGKTLAFGLPLLAQLGPSRPRRPRGLILVPTRELAEQIRRELDPLAEAVGRSLLAVYGGIALGPQARALSHGVDVVVACPGRLQDLIRQGAVELDDVDQVVVDEADRMADMGFLPDVADLLDRTSLRRQTLLFSATLDDDIAVLSERYQRKPTHHEVGETEPDLSLVEHRFIATDKGIKLGLAADLIEDHGPTMLFCRTRHGVDRVARQLKRVGVKAGWIHGGRTQAQRDAALSAFTTGRVAVLVATDVAARGIHVDGVACVIHYDPPADHKDYVHRSGRTARAGSGGVVVSLVNSDQRGAVARLRQRVGLPAGDPEPAPALRPRTVEPWVDQRPPRRHRASKSPTTSGSTADRAPRKHRAAPDRTPDSTARGIDPTADHSNGSGPHADPMATRTNDEGSHSEPVARTVDSDPGSASEPQRRASKRPPVRRSAGKAKAKAGRKRPGKGKATAKAKTKTSKRSGRPRSKDHKQRRRR